MLFRYIPTSFVFWGSTIYFLIRISRNSFSTVIAKAMIWENSFGSFPFCLIDSDSLEVISSVLNSVTSAWAPPAIRTWSTVRFHFCRCLLSAAISLAKGLFFPIFCRKIWPGRIKHLLMLLRRNELIDQISVHLLYILKKCFGFENILSAGEPLDIINVSLLKNLATRTDLTMFVLNLFFRPNMSAVLIIKHVSGRPFNYCFSPECLCQQRPDEYGNSS